MNEASDIGDGLGLPIPAFPPAPLPNHEAGGASDDSSHRDGDGDGDVDSTSTPPPQKPKPKHKRQTRPALPWTARIEELRYFQNLHGHVKVPKDYPPNPSLSSWVDNQRRQRKLKYEGKPSSLTDERETILNEMGFWWGFQGGKRVATFEDRIEDLRRWREANWDGHGCAAASATAASGTSSAAGFAPSDIIKGYARRGNVNAPPPENKSLYEWTRRQLERYQGTCKGAALSAEREETLRSVGLRLVPKDTTTKSKNWGFQEGYDNLVTYKEKFGHCNVTGTEGEDQSQEGGGNDLEYEKLKTWVDRQRNKLATLKEDQVADLKNIGFLFTKWDVMYDKLERWKAEHSPNDLLHAPKTKSLLSAKRDLKGWIELQRANVRKWQTNKLPHNSEVINPERIAKLLKIGVDLLPADCRRQGSSNVLIERTLWKVKLDELRAYKDHFGDCNVPQHFSMNRALGKWVKEQRVQVNLRKEGKPSTLTDDQFDALKRVGFEEEEEEEEAAPPAKKKKKKSPSPSLAGTKRYREGLKGRTQPDGSILPVEIPERGPGGTFLRPSGRGRKGMEWDSNRGIWVPTQGLEASGSAKVGKKKEKKKKGKKKRSNDCSEERIPAASASAVGELI